MNKKKLVIRITAGVLGLALLIIQEYFFYQYSVLVSSMISAFMAIICGGILFSITKDNVSYIICTIASTVLIVVLTLYMIVFRSGSLENGMIIILINVMGINIFPLIYQFLTRKLRQYEKYRTILTYYFGVAYCISLVFLLFFGLHRDMSVTVVNMTPFETIGPYILGTVKANTNVIVMNLLGNIILFVPLGSLFIMLLRKRWHVVLSILLAPILIEIIQYVTKTGCMDIDDFILNFLGEVIGVLIVVMVEKGYARKHRESKKKLLEIR